MDSPSRGGKSAASRVGAIWHTLRKMGDACSHRVALCVFTLWAPAPSMRRRSVEGVFEDPGDKEQEERKSSP